MSYSSWSTLTKMTRKRVYGDRSRHDWNFEAKIPYCLSQNWTISSRTILTFEFCWFTAFRKMIIKAIKNWRIYQHEWKNDFSWYKWNTFMTSGLGNINIDNDHKSRENFLWMRIEIKVNIFVRNVKNNFGLIFIQATKIMSNF